MQTAPPDARIARMAASRSAGSAALGSLDTATAKTITARSRTHIEELPRARISQGLWSRFLNMRESKLQCDRRSCSSWLFGESRHAAAVCCGERLGQPRLSFFYFLASLKK